MGDTMIFWAIVSRFGDVLQLVGFGTILYYSVKLSIKVSRKYFNKRDTEA
jgi:hypothetical protein